jgi:multimeric flavodoxin WrbA
MVRTCHQVAAFNMVSRTAVNGSDKMKAMVLNASPRRNGNSAMLAESLGRGIEDSGHEVEFLFADDVVKSFLRDCRTCRGPDGECTIDDGFRNTFFEKYLPAGGFVAVTPIYWYGMSAQLKAFFDRMFCYVAASHPLSPAVVAGMQAKRIGLVLSSEENYPAVSAGIIHQLQEYSRYTHSTFVGTVHGIGNSRGDVLKDPREPLEFARRFGQTFFSAQVSDYRIDTPRPARVWG